MQQRRRESSLDPTMGSNACVGYLHAAPLVTKDMKEMDLLKTEKERNMIRNKLEDSGLQISFCADVANTCNFGRMLNSRCQVLHYAGHANDNFLAFESSVPTECGVVEPLEVAPLKSMFEAGGRGVNTKLVVISSCCSELSGNAFIEAGVPHVVAVKKGQSVLDEAAQEFSEQFYDALTKNITVRKAFESALSTVDAGPYKPREEGDHFLLLPKDGNHDVRIFDALPEGGFTDNTRFPPPRPSCDRGVTFYRGLVGLQKVVRLLVDPVTPCVTITGEHGSGRTERAIQASDYVRERHHFDSVLWADCNYAVDAEVTPSWPAPPPAASPAESSGALEGSADSAGDLGRLVGIAAGMPYPGPNSVMDLHGFLFKNPANDAERPVNKVLLVLENADSLLERGGNARDCLVMLLSKLCSMGENQRLKLLVTSEQRLLLGTAERFRDGSEVEARVEKLKGVDAYKLLKEKLPRNFTRKELGFQKHVSLTDKDIERAVMTHPELTDVITQGHPGMLGWLATTLLDNLGKSGMLKDMAARYREEVRGTHRRSRHLRSMSGASFASQTSAITSGSSSHTAPSTPPLPPYTGQPKSYDVQLGSNGCFLHPGGGSSPVGRVNHTRSRSYGESERMLGPVASHPAIMQRTRTGGFNGAGVHGGPFWDNNQRIDHGHPPHAFPPHAFPPQAFSQQAFSPQAFSPQAFPPNAFEQWSPPPPPPPLPPPPPPPCSCQHLQQLHELEAARLSAEDCSRIAAAALLGPEPPRMNRHEQLSWDSATVAGVDPDCLLVWVFACADASEDKWSRDRDGAPVPGFVPWECLKNCLAEHLSGKLTAPPSDQQCRGAAAAADERPYGRIGSTDEEEEEDDDDDDDDERGDGSSLAAGEGEGDGSCYDSIDSEQGRVLEPRELEFLRGVLKKKQDELAPRDRRSGAAAAAGRGRGGGGGGGDADMISVEAFAAFSLWWGPLVRTLSLVRGDWEATDPTRLHLVEGVRADEVLEGGKPGTFLFRFSERKPGLLVVGYRTNWVRKRPVNNCRVNVSEEGCVVEGDSQRYASLRDLVMERTYLTRLYPDTPKGEAFDKEASSSAEEQ